MAKVQKLQDFSGIKEIIAELLEDIESGLVDGTILILWETKKDFKMEWEGDGFRTLGLLDYAKAQVGEWLVSEMEELC